MILAGGGTLHLVVTKVKNPATGNAGRKSTMLSQHSPHPQEGRLMARQRLKNKKIFRALSP
jgi:hypothetical protein